jgi:hypothetical protein
MRACWRRMPRPSLHAARVGFEESWVGAKTEPSVIAGQVAMFDHLAQGPVMAVADQTG